MKIDHLMIRTTDLDESIKFYTELFEMEVDSMDDYPEEKYTLCFLKDPETEVMIELTYNYDIEHYELGNTFDHIGFRGDEVMKTVDKAESLGYKTRHKIHTTSEEKRYLLGFITSPEGIIIALVQKLCPQTSNENPT